MTTLKDIIRDVIEQEKELDLSDIKNREYLTDRIGIAVAMFIHKQLK